MSQSNNNSTVKTSISLPITVWEKLKQYPNRSGIISNALTFYFEREEYLKKAEDEYWNNVGMHLEEHDQSYISVDDELSEYHFVHQKGDFKIVLSDRFIFQVEKLKKKKGLQKSIMSCMKDVSKNGKKSSYYKGQLSGKWSGAHELDLQNSICILIRIHEQKRQIVFGRIGKRAEFGI